MNKKAQVEQMLAKGSEVLKQVNVAAPTSTTTNSTLRKPNELVSCLPKTDLRRMVIEEVDEEEEEQA